MSNSAQRFHPLSDDENEEQLQQFEVDIDVAAATRRASQPKRLFGVRYAVLGGCALVLGLLVLLIVLVAQSGSSSTQSSIPTGVSGAAMHAIVVGDWGREGTINQAQVAAQMGAAANEFSVQFVSSVGDNFYTYGVKDVDDPLFQASWQDVYTQESLRTIPWHVVAGNHDWRGSVQAQIDFSDKDPSWNFPSTYFYREETVAPGVCASFVYIDTSPFIPYYYEGKDKAMMPNMQHVDSSVQEAWWATTFPKARASCKYFFVLGHHPAYSGGMHGNNPTIVEKLLPLLREHKADAYIAGHDHNMQHLQVDGFNMFVSGAGSDVRDDLDHDAAALKYGQSVPGFMLLSANSTNVAYEFIGTEGQLLYRFDSKAQNL